MGDKKIRILLLFHLNEHYIEKMEAMMTKDGEFDAGVIGYAYEVHDMNMSYILYGKEAWNCYEGGFLYCPCKRKERI